MAIALHPLRLLFLASLVLAEGSNTARAETVNPRMRVSAEIVVSCTLEAHVPRVGTPERQRGAARFSVTCTQAAVATAMPCQDACGGDKLPQRRTEYRAGSRGDGAAIATLLF